MPVKLVSAGGGGVILQPASSIGSDVVIETPVTPQRLIGDKTPGAVLQVVSATLTTFWGSSGSSGWYDVGGLSLSITPQSASNKILLIANIFGGLSDFNNFNYYWRFMRNSTPVSVGTEGTQVNVTGGHNMYLNGGSVPFAGSMSGNFLDSPATISAITYKLQVSPWDSNGVIYVNRRGASINNCGTSTITAIELAA